jgi:transposase
MPFTSRRSNVQLSAEVKQELVVLRGSRTAPAHRVERARILLAYAGGQSVSTIARDLRMSRPTVERCLNKALELGVRAALDDLPGRGRKARLTLDARAWVINLACQKPKELGYAQELWTTRLLMTHVRQHAAAAGHPSLARLGRGTVSKILRAGGVQPHKVRYYLERRDPEFEAKMTQVLCVYKQVELLQHAHDPAGSMTAILSFDEKPGIQAISNTAPDRPPVPEHHAAVGRDHEYVRHGTMTLMAGINLLTGHVHGQVVERHRSREFIEFLRAVDAFYPPEATIRVVLDNHSAHISKETRSYLATRANRFEFIFTPKHGSWLNLIEAFFGKLAKTMLRGLRVVSKAELKARLEQHLDELNKEPVVFHWKYGLESLAVA